jgi:predicted TIM-barrel fold metal-dependent hydrolase
MGQGSTSPIILSRVDGATLVEAIAAMKENPAIHIDTHLLKMPDGLSRIKDLVGVERILFGSGAAAHSLGAAFAYVQRSSLSDPEKAAVLGGNAARVIGGL